MTYKPGDVILANEPFALAVAVKMIPVVCSWCFKTTKEVPLSVCAGCKTLKYCSSACQKEDWLKGPHKNECKYLKYQIVPGQTRLICRIIFKLRAGLGDAEYQLPDGTKTSYNKTIGHASHVLSKGDGTQELASTWKSVKSLWVRIPRAYTTRSAKPTAKSKETVTYILTMKECPLPMA